MQEEGEITHQVAKFYSLKKKSIVESLQILLF